MSSIQKCKALTVIPDDIVHVSRRVISILAGVKEDGSPQDS
jgi:hypothetical protein